MSLALSMKNWLTYSTASILCFLASMAKSRLSIFLLKSILFRDHSAREILNVSFLPEANEKAGTPRLIAAEAKPAVLMKSLLFVIDRGLRVKSYLVIPRHVLILPDTCYCLLTVAFSLPTGAKTIVTTPDLLPLITEY